MVPLNAGIFLRFLKRSRERPRSGRSILVVRQSMRPHRAKIVAARSGTARPNFDKIERVELPPLCARARPRRVRRRRRQAGHGAPPSAQGQGQAQGRPQVLHARSAEADPAKIRAFFQAPAVRYAAFAIADA